MMWLNWLIEFQRDIHESITGSITALANDSSPTLLISLLPIAMVFGATHALTPGHNKLMLATYVAASPLSLIRTLMISFALSFTHVTMAVVIALFSLPLVSRALGAAGKTPELTMLSRTFLIGIGIYMLWRAFRTQSDHHHGEGLVFGITAGLIPCPLTLFMMTLAMARGVPEAGVAFAIAMMVGVAATLSLVALLSYALRGILQERIAQYQYWGRWLEGAAAVLLVFLATAEFINT